MSDDLDDYLATLTDEERQEIERLAVLELEEFLALASAAGGE